LRQCENVVAARAAEAVFWASIGVSRCVAQIAASGLAPRRLAGAHVESFDAVRDIGERRGIGAGHPHLGAEPPERGKKRRAPKCRSLRVGIELKELVGQEPGTAQ
jgi:hypothetical protein